MSIPKRLIDKLQEAYDQEKRKEVEELHNDIVDLIGKRQANIHNVIFVLEILKWEYLRASYEQMLGHALVPPGGGAKKDAKFESGTAQ